MVYTNYNHVKRVIVRNDLATVTFIDNVTKKYVVTKLPKYILKFMDTRICESDNMDNCKIYEQLKPRKKYSMKKRQPERYTLYGDAQHRPDGTRFTANEIDIITVCEYRMYNIKDACKNCCYRDATFENTRIRGLRKSDIVCYGCKDFISKYNAYPDTFMWSFEEGE